MSFLPRHSIFFSSIKEDLAFLLKDLLSMSQSEIYSLLEKPKKEDHGHIAMPLFKLSKEHKKNPATLAQEVVNQINSKKFSQIRKAEAFSGFVNFTLDINFLRSHLNQLIKQEKLACFPLEKPPHWVIDFASPNVAKYMNVGHLRATVIGQALVNLAASCGCRVTSINHLGDWGTQFGKLLWAYQKWSKEYDFNEDPLKALVALYVRFHDEIKSHPQRDKEAALLFQKLESGDEELKILWKRFIEISLSEYNRQWKLLNVKHNKVLGESFYIPLFEDLKNRLTKKKILKESEGALVVFLEENLPPCLIQKTDGASTYAARDLCSAIYRFENLKADRNIYVTGSDQKLHFEQVFKTLQKAGEKGESCKHVSFGMYRFKDKGKMSSRQGKAIYLESLLTQAQERVHEIIKDRDLENKNQIAKDVGIGALIFNDLMNDCVRDVDFDWGQLLDFEGRTGPFVQYTHVRCLSLLKKYGKQAKASFESSDSTCSKEEERVILRLLSFEESVFQAFSHFKPHILASYLLDLSRDFNRFYAQQKILGTDKEERLMVLVNSVGRVLKRGLEILNVPIPSKM